MFEENGVEYCKVISYSYFDFVGYFFKYIYERYVFL